MKVVRKDLFDFVVSFNGQEFEMLKDVSNEFNNQVEDMLAFLITDNLEDNFNSLE